MSLKLVIDLQHLWMTQHCIEKKFQGTADVVTVELMNRKHEHPQLNPDNLTHQINEIKVIFENECKYIIALLIHTIVTICKNYNYRKLQLQNYKRQKTTAYSFAKTTAKTKQLFVPDSNIQCLKEPSDII